MSVYNAIFKDVSVMSGLKKIDAFELINNESIINFENNELKVSLLKEALMEEGVIDNEIYELLVMTYNDLNDIEVTFTFEVEEEEVSVNGYINEKDISVSSIIINEVKI